MSKNTLPQQSFSYNINPLYTQHLFEYFDSIEAQYSGYWFETFLKYTNQKTVTANVLQKLFQNLKSTHTLDNKISMVDVGCGEGELALKILKNWEQNYSDTNYYGIDHDSRFIDLIDSKMTTLGINHTNIVGNCFKDGLSKIQSHGNIVLASNIAYYANDINLFIQEVLAKKSEDGFALFIHESPTSFPNTMRNKYDGYLDQSAATQISEYLMNKGENFVEFIFASKISLPENIELLQKNDLVSENLFTRFDYSETTMDAKFLLEFIVQAPLESMAYTYTLDSYLSDVQIAKVVNNNQLPIESLVQIVLPNDFMMNISGILDCYSFKYLTDFEDPIALCN